jgi:hypothetical protein
MREETTRRARESEAGAECPDHVLLRLDAIDAIDTDRIERERRARMRAERALLEPLEYAIDE